MQTITQNHIGQETVRSVKPHLTENECGHFRLVTSSNIPWPPTPGFRRKEAFLYDV